MLVKPESKQKKYNILLAFPVIIILAIFSVIASNFIVSSVSENTEQLVVKQIPELKAIAELQTILNRKLIMLHDYYATLEAPDPKLKNNLHELFMENLQLITHLSLNKDNENRLSHNVNNFNNSEQDFHKEMQKGSKRDWDILREHLSTATKYAQMANEQLVELNQQIQDRVAKGGSITLKDVSSLNLIQLTFSLIMVIIAGFLLLILYLRMNDQAKLFHNAYFDSLTDLPNRRSLNSWSENLISKDGLSNKLHVIWLTLDRLGLISGTYGHYKGDELIHHFSKNLEKTLEQSEIEVNLFSMGSSNWVMIIKNNEHENDVKTIIEQIEKFSSKPFRLFDNEFNIACSIGIASNYSENKSSDNNNIEVLLRNADMAKRSVMNEGGNDHQFYDSSLTDAAEKMLSLENDLRKALELDKYELHYQPKLSIQGDRVLSAEALIRYRSNGELISPAVFIPVAEKTGLICQIGDWVLREACMKWVEWHKTGINIPSVAVNISAQQFQSKQFIETVRKIITETGMPPEKLELEITEEAASADPDQIVHVMENLKKIGISIAIDDFGTGYSSLAYLKRFPIDVLKIDRAFICQLETSDQDKAIAKMIIEMSHQLGFKVVAEGVENKEQWMILKDMDCDLLQGFYFSRPLVSDDYLAFLKKT